MNDKKLETADAHNAARLGSIKTLEDLGQRILVNNNGYVTNPAYRAGFNDGVQAAWNAMQTDLGTLANAPELGTPMPDLAPLHACQFSTETVVTHVTEALGRLRHGEIVIKVVDGKPVWVEVHEKTRIER